MIEGIPGTPFQDEVVIRRLRWSSDETGFAIIDADRAGDEVVLVGTIAHLEERERVRIDGLWQDDRRYGLQVKVATAEPLAPVGRRRAARVPEAGAARRERAGRPAARVVRRGCPGRHRPRPTRRLPQARPRPGTRRGGGQVLGRPALEPSAAFVARATRARVARPAHREALRRARPPRRPRAPVRPHQRVRRRVPDGRHDRALSRRRRRLARADARGCAACAERGGAGRLDVPAAARARGPSRRVAGHGAGRRPVQRDGRGTRAGARDRRPRVRLGLPTRDRTARARPRGDRARAGGRALDAQGRGTTRGRRACPGPGPVSARR